MTTPPVRLTERERTVLEMLAAGYDFEEIESCINPGPESFGTVNNYLSAAAKLQGNGVANTVALAIRGGHIL